MPCLSIIQDTGFMVCDDNDDIVLLLHCIYSMQAIDLLLRLDTGTRQ